MAITTSVAVLRDGIGGGRLPTPALERDHQPGEGEQRSEPESEHPFHLSAEALLDVGSLLGESAIHLALRLSASSFELGFEFPEPHAHICETHVHLGPQVRDPLLQFGFEPLEIQLVQLAQVVPIRRIHLIEPVHEFVRNVVPEMFVEFPRESGGHGHRSLFVFRMMPTLQATLGGPSTERWRCEPIIRRRWWGGCKARVPIPMALS